MVQRQARLKLAKESFLTQNGQTTPNSFYRTSGVAKIVASLTKVIRQVNHPQLHPLVHPQTHSYLNYL